MWGKVATNKFVLKLFVFKILPFLEMFETSRYCLILRRQLEKMIQSLKIENFKSIRNQRVELGNLNIFIGPNGAGKSNFISFFRFLKHFGEGTLENYVYESGGINTFLYKGFEVSGYLEVEVGFIEHNPHHDFPVTSGFKIISDGETYHIGYQSYGGLKTELKGGVKESISRPHTIGLIDSSLDKYGDALRIYHFHDTSDNAQIKLPQDIEDVYHFKAEGENLAPFLLLLKEQHFDSYRKIVETVRLVYPFFHDFVLEESPRAKGKVVLRWKEKGNGVTYTARQISDGTLRFICLATLLIQPDVTSYVPRTVILDEPELGLHPFALHILAELIQKAAMEKQLLIATQSVSLINYFTPKDLLITERAADGDTEFKRLKDEDFSTWLEDYSLGQLWESNFFGGRP